MACANSRLGIAYTAFALVAASIGACDSDGTNDNYMYVPDRGSDDIQEINEDSGDPDLPVDVDPSDVVELDGPDAGPDVWVDVADSIDEMGDPDVLVDLDIGDEGQSVCDGAPVVVINELSASNVSAVPDEEGDYPDWIELRNLSSETVSLAGWGLSDNPDSLAKWVFPDVEIAPGVFLVVFASGKDRRSVVRSWDTRLDRGDDWRYLAVDSSPPADWSEPEFMDSGWPSGPSGFGRGDNDDATELDAHTIYVRATIDLDSNDLADLTSLFLHIDYDDAFLARLNGEEVARSHLVSPVPDWDNVARISREASLYRGEDPEMYWLGDDLELLHEGENLFTLEVHDFSSSSSDLSLIPIVTLGFASDRPTRRSFYVDMPISVLHANFKLSASGESVILTEPGGCVVDRVDFGVQHVDESIGRTSSEGSHLNRFREVTPGAPNALWSYFDLAPAPTITPSSGHYPSGTQIEIISGSSSTEVRYTLDGSEPGVRDRLYVEPILVASSAGVVTVRARGFESGRWASRIATATYFSHVPESLAVLALVTDPVNLWDDDTGIYDFGDDYTNSPPYFDANFWRDWERPVHVSFWEPDGTLGFDIECGLQIHGKYSRAFPQRSLRLLTRSGYGAPSIEHPVFGAEAVSSFTRLLLRNSGTDWHGCNDWECRFGLQMRDGIAQRIAGDVDLDVSAYRPAIVYLNGDYWGIYNLRERLDRRYVESYHGYDDIDLLERGALAMEGDNTHYLTMMDFIRSNDMADESVFSTVQTMMDTDNFATYQSVEIFLDNRDWPGGNIKFWRPRTVMGRWRWLLFDVDAGLGRKESSGDGDSLALALDSDSELLTNPPWSTELFRLLLQNPSFRRDFINRYADYLNTMFRSEVTRAILEEAAQVIESEIPRHVARWGRNTESGEVYEMPEGAWEDAIDALDAWLLDRPDYARQHIVDNFELAGTYNLILSTSPPESATFQLTGVAVEPPFDGLYFLGVPVTITVVPNPGSTFTGWSDAELGDQLTVTIDPDGDTSLTAQFE